jgi:hypothetical protein
MGKKARSPCATCAFVKSASVPTDSPKKLSGRWGCRPLWAWVMEVSERKLVPFVRLPSTLSRAGAPYQDNLRLTPDHVHILPAYPAAYHSLPGSFAPVPPLSTLVLLGKMSKNPTGMSVEGPFCRRVRIRLLTFVCLRFIVQSMSIRQKSSQPTENFCH